MGGKLPCRTKASASASSSGCLCLRINSLQAVSLALPPGLEALGEERSPATAGMAGALPDRALQALARCAGALRTGRASSQITSNAQRGLWPGRDAPAKRGWGLYWGCESGWVGLGGHRWAGIGEPLQQGSLL